MLTIVKLESNIIASDTPAHSMAALYSTFISGLTLLQTLAIQRDIIPHRRSARGIRACTSVLVTYATLFPEARELMATRESCSAKLNTGQSLSGLHSTTLSMAWKMKRQSRRTA